MDEEEKGLYTVAEAAEAWGISKQAVYKRLNNLTTNHSTKDNQLTTGPLVVVKGRTRYITREGMLFFQQDDNPLLNQVEQPVEQPQSTFKPEVDKLNNQLNSLQEELNQAKTALLAEQGRANTLQATVEAQQAHIDSLKTALDREQALHMASLQKALPAPRRGLFDWLKGRKGEE